MLSLRSDLELAHATSEHSNRPVCCSVAGHRRNAHLPSASVMSSAPHRLFIAVEDKRPGGSLGLEVKAVDTLEAFRYPYLHAGAAMGYADARCVTR